MTTWLIVARRHLGKPPLRVLVEKRERRAVKMARAMAAAGFLAWQIRQASGLRGQRLQAVLAGAKHVGLWSPEQLQLIQEVSRGDL